LRQNPVLERRAVPERAGRLYYAVAEGPESWSVGLGADGGFAGNARSTVRKLTSMPFSAISSWRTTSALPRWRRNHSRSQSFRPASFHAPLRLLVGDESACFHVSLNRVMAAAELLVNPLQPQATAHSRSIAATSSGSFKTSLHGPFIRIGLSSIR
jgi:hypothetical protein